MVESREGLKMGDGNARQVEYRRWRENGRKIGYARWKIEEGVEDEESKEESKEGLNPQPSRGVAC